ncbi:type II 3-dehydroquinate dehydratase [Sphingobium sp. HBC34]|uniref:3-dehydroquinate dehydratase n=1 Tax=Sphingobium cyanobacteriorum TaxID=3063954 RepID=A0ABT8ZP29_9SPHN|nr:type II 3-dehydroquinate dehydratase [Sphingobium sp. HBC34]MDO7835510.1 type II 3-dehydroquinate dehydratase [Sphingobium sp. HBC34]
MGQRFIHVLNGPNLDHLGVREPHIYGHQTLADVEAACRRALDGSGIGLIFRQTNAEHEMIGWLHEARTGAMGIVINPAAFSYAGYPVLDALKMCDCPVIEVHISNIHRRDEAWRSHSIMSRSVTAMLSGMGIDGYALAVRHLLQIASQNSRRTAA